MSVNGQNICPARMIQAEVFYSVHIFSMVIDQISRKTVFSKVRTPYVICRRQVTQPESVSCQSCIYGFPAFSSRFANCPDRAVTNVTVGRIGVVRHMMIGYIITSSWYIKSTVQILHSAFLSLIPHNRLFCCLVFFFFHHKKMLFCVFPV